MEVSTKINKSMETTPSQVAYELGLNAVKSKKSFQKQKLGQYFTPLNIARLMASRISIDTQKKKIKILDPGCGLLILSACLIEKIIEVNGIEEIELTCYELDNEIIDCLMDSILYIEKWLLIKGISFKYRLIQKDFVEEITASGNVANDEDILKYAYYDYVISNPPYYKITKYDQKLKDVLPQLSEQPNIYFLFLYESALRLKEGGEMVFLIPRSFFSGGFFKQFRDILLNIVSLETIHLFQDNKELFEDSGVLSEFVIIKAVKNSLLEEHLLKITCSSREEEDIDFDYSYVLDRKSNIIMLPKSEDDVKIIEKVNSFGSSLRKFNLEIKQGNILNSRMEKFILPANSTFETAAPYITCATLSDGKANRTLVCHETEKLLIPNKNYILFLRYNTKRAYKGITAVPYYQQKHDSKNIFIDKQLNYIDKIGGGLNEREVDAIVEILNSEIIQKYIKIINGEMNVSTEMLYDIPLPQDIL